MRNLGDISLGNRVRLVSYPNGSPFKTALSTYRSDATISIGDHSNINGAIIHAMKSVTIGKYCMLAPGVTIIDNDSHRVCVDPLERRGTPEAAPVVLEDNVWIGSGALILKGVVVGENSIVGANSVVTRSVRANCIVAGNPAVEIRSLI